MNQLRRYYADQQDFCLCPMTRKPDVSWRYGGTFDAWANLGSGDTAVQAGDFGSYGINDWCYNPRVRASLYLPETDMLPGALKDMPKRSFYWKGSDVRGAYKIPLFFDCIWTDAWPYHNCPPPKWQDYAEMTDVGDEQMRRVCIERHEAAINMLFLDNTVKPVGLKELWTLKWHPHFKTQNRYTLAGGATKKKWLNWASWMVYFKDY